MFYIAYDTGNYVWIPDAAWPHGAEIASGNLPVSVKARFYKTLTG